MTAIFGIFFFAFIVFFVMSMFNFLRKNMSKLKRNGLIAIACFVISMIAVGVSGSVTVTPKEEAAPESKTATKTAAAPAAEPAPVEAAKTKDSTTDKPVDKEPTAEEWEASYQQMVLNETQSYITSSVKKALSKDAYESRLGVIEKYSQKVGADKKEAFSRLAAAVKVNDLDKAKAIYKELGGEDFPELNQDAKPVELAEAPPSTPAGEAVAITAAEFAKIKNGMGYEEVATIVGGPGELLSESGSEGDEFHTVMYMWYGEDGISNANFMFQGGKLINKAQLGLE